MIEPPCCLGTGMNVLGEPCPCQRWTRPPDVMKIFLGLVDRILAAHEVIGKRAEKREPTITEQEKQP